MNSDGTGQRPYGPATGPWRVNGAELGRRTHRASYGTRRAAHPAKRTTSTSRLRTSRTACGSIRPPAFDWQQDFSPDGSAVVFTSHPSFTTDPGDIHVIGADGTGEVNLTNTDDAYEISPDWQPIPINAYPRPKGASPMQVSLVPAYQPCTAPNSTHGAPLSFSSCTPPQLASDHLTTGTPDANGRAVRMNAALTIKVDARRRADRTPT